MEKNLTPKKIVEELDKYIISQEEAKKSVAISLRNRHRRKMIEDCEMRMEITPKNIILIGSTGVGKTEIARRLAKIVDAPFIKVEATKYTEVGYVGKDVESIIKDFANITFKNLKDKKIESLKENYYEATIEELAKIHRPYDVLNDEMKKNIIHEIKSGDLDDVEIELEILKHKTTHGDMSLMNNDDVKSIISNIVGDIKGEKKLVKFKIKSAIQYLLNEKINSELDEEELFYATVEKVQEDGIVFIDEIDKIVEKEGSERGEISRQGVQRDLLPIIEGCTVITKYGAVKTDHILFIGAGSFSQSNPSDMMPELQGRFPVKVKLENLMKKDFIRILTEVKYNILDQYKALLEKDMVELIFTKTGIEAIAGLAVTMNEKVENLGARRLSAILESLLQDIMFNAPYEETKKITIDKKFIFKIFQEEYKEEDLDKYIL
ncbi:MAG: ATP-dependent protease ATPase subunit HslU [Fusobacteriaceae bacterium]